MKNSVFQFIIIIILLIGMVGIIIVVKTNITRSNNSDYYPVSDADNADIDVTMISLDGYIEVEITEHTFPIFGELYNANTYYDRELSFEEVELDTVAVNIGDRVNVDDILGQKANNDIPSSVNGLVVAKTDTQITLKVLTSLYADFFFNIYDNKTYYVGDEFDVFKNGEKITTAQIIYIDYLNIIDDCVKTTVQINNENLFLISDSYLELAPVGYKVKTVAAISANVLGIQGDDYKILNSVSKFIYMKDSTVLELEITFGISYYGFVEIKAISS